MPQIAGFGAHLCRPTEADAPGQQLGNVKVRQIVRELQDDGWVQVRQVGRHRQFRQIAAPFDRNASSRNRVVSKQEADVRSLEAQFSATARKLKPGRNAAIGMVAASASILVQPLDLPGRPPSPAISWNAWYEALVA